MQSNSPYDKRKLTEEEFGKLFRKCRPLFVSIADSYVHDRTIAEDQVDDGFALLWERRNELRTDSFEAWLFRTVIRNCLDYLRSKKTQSKIRENIHDARYRMLLHEIRSLESCDPNRLYRDEIETIFHDCLDRMPSTTREIFLASRFREMTYQEIAAERGIPVRQVTAEIQTALALLKRQLKDYLPLALVLFLFEK